ncbi:MAG: hypothetical protein ACXAC8_16240 [Candidatus Hodarchaeales archaeon]|jgi:hypothetical protein
MTLDIIYGFVLMFEVIVALIIGLFIINRDKSNRLNQLFLIVMFSFAGYLLSESIIYLLAIEDLMLIDLFRDFSVFCSCTSSVLLLVSALAVQYGDFVVEKRINLIFIIIVILALTLIGIPYDSGSISGNYVIFQSDILGKIALLVIPALMVVSSMVIFMFVRQSSEEPFLRQKMLRLTVGLGLIIVGIAYFAIFPEFRYPGHVSYIIGLFILFWAFK